jgi:serine/threonine protein kinase
MFSDPEGSSSGSSSEAEEPLSGQIWMMFEKSPYDRNAFLPEGYIDELITKSAVMKELELKDLDNMSDRIAVEFILNHAKKIFAITLGVGFPSKFLIKVMTQFCNKGFVDAELPITEANMYRIPFIGDGKMKPKSPWTKGYTTMFLEKQWAFLAPVFSKQNQNLELHTSNILPFTHKLDGVKSGAFGEVQQVTIHARHHLDPILMVSLFDHYFISFIYWHLLYLILAQFDGERANVAVKEIKQGNTTDEKKLLEAQSDWKREVKAHIDIGKLGHSNIIEFIAAFTRSSRYLMFRWADGGNLREFWQSKGKPKLNPSLVRDVILQLRGLADALNNMHDLGYRHGDVKPENILCVRTKSLNDPQLDVGILKIADMGLAKHHNVATENRQDPTSMKYTTYRYEPPEARLSSGALGQGRSRRYDIWSVGCVTLEFIIWLLYGPEMLDDFNNHIVGPVGEPSHFFQIENLEDGRKMSKVHPAVDAAMDALLKDQECRQGVDTALRDLLDIVKTKLLVTNLGLETVSLKEHSPEEMKQIHVGSRAHAWMLRDELDVLIGKGENNESYWFTGKSRDKIHRLLITPPPQAPALQKPSHLSPGAKLGNGQKLLPIRHQEPTPRPIEDFSFIVPTQNQVSKVRKNEADWTVVR